MNNILFKRIIIIIILLFFTLLVIKVNIKTYVGDFSHIPCRTDIQLKIDGELILNDTLVSSPYFPVIIDKKLRYGFHTINVSSEQACVNQENRILLLPHQYIYIEFLGADTLRLNGDSIFNENYPNEEDCIPLIPGLDTMKIVIRTKSEYIIESRFNPFYTE